MKKKQAGFSLVELTLALSIAAFALVAIFGLLPVGVSSSQSAIEQTTINSVMAEVIADVRATSAGATVSDRFEIALPLDPSAGAPSTTLFFNADGGFSSTLQPDSRYRLVVSSASADHPDAATPLLLEVSWPAVADPQRSAGKVRNFAAVLRK